jgi:hypothetical protein
MSLRTYLAVLSCAASLATAQAILAADVTSTREAMSEASLRPASIDNARAQSLAWLQAQGKSDAATLERFKSIWIQDDQSVLDRVAATFALGDARAAELLTEAQNPEAPAPTAMPDLLKDEKQPVFFRANLALAYAKALSARRVDEEALATLRLIRPDQVVDPAAYFFHRAVAEHALLLKNDANRSIVGVLEDVSDAPERYKLVATLMAYDMKGWKDKDLGEIARKMDNIERRLALARGGPKTQKIQKEVIARLDEIIKQLENQSSGKSNGGCPNGGNKPSSGSGTPMEDSQVAPFDAKGIAGNQRLSKLVKDWGKLPEKERTKAMLELTRDMPARHREVIENYIKKISSVPPNAP